MSKNISDDVVSALLAEHASQLGSTFKKTSRSSRRKPKCSGTSTKPTKADVPIVKSGQGLTEDSTDADNRLREFIQGLRPTTLPDGTEYWYEREASRRYTLEEIGDIMGVSRERVRQIEEGALRKMWRMLTMMTKREGLNTNEWLKIATDCAKEEDTIYYPS
jgi:hypothetical protein